MPGAGGAGMHPCLSLQMPSELCRLPALQASSLAGFHQGIAFHLKCHRSIYSYHSYHPSPEKTGVRPFIY
jgi:hypothetical protein